MDSQNKYCHRDTEAQGKISLCLRASVAFFLFGKILFAQASPYILIRTFTTHDSIMLRWIPSTVEAWKLGNENGYVIERFTKDEFPNGKANFISSPILPLPKTDSTWNELIRTDKLNAFVFQSLFEETKTTDPEKSKIEEQTKFGFVLKAADLSVSTAKAEGLFFCDKGISPGQVYVYRISIASIPVNEKQISATAIVNGKISALDFPANIRGDFKNKKASIAFDVSTTREQYAGFIVERSEDSLHFVRVNPTLLVFAKSQYEENKTELVYQDTFPQNHKTYWYRVRGYSFFGVTGPASEMVKGKGREEWTVFPLVDTLFSNDNKSVEMKWHLNEAIDFSQLKNFSVLRASKADGSYQEINFVPLDKTSLSFVDEHPAFANYYRIVAISIDNDSGFSFPYFFQLQDNDPPPVPQHVKGSIDTSGIVHLTWEKVSANDLKGYRVFRCNSLKEEFHEVSDSILSRNDFTDTVTLHTLTHDVYYCVRSVDKLYNNSKNSSPCLLKRPDKIPPIAPVAKSIVQTDSSIHLTWINSGSDDVMCVELFRKSSNGEISQLTSCAGKDTVQRFTDFLASAGMDYSYSLTVTDSSGNKSMTGFPTIHYQPRIYPTLNGFSAIPDFEKRDITLSWLMPNAQVDRYIIYKSKKGEPMRTWKTVNGNFSSIIDKELYPGNTYIYQVKAILKNGSETKLVETEVVF